MRVASGERAEEQRRRQEAGEMVRAGGKRAEDVSEARERKICYASIIPSRGLQDGVHRLIHSWHVSTTYSPESLARERERERERGLGGVFCTIHSDLSSHYSVS
eukprot:Tamp_40283.p1 GENE.Tamp_40283~~Tamp_40283.p1  ORF type:complete len:122 (+),score=4.73 Tamp_40283:55-366(+)